MKIRCIRELSPQTMEEIKSQYEICEDTSAQVIIGNPDPLSIPDYPHLELIQLDSAGYDQYDVEKLNENKIRLCNASGCFDDVISEYVIGMMIMMYQKLDQYVLQQKQHTWKRMDQVRMISGSTVVVVGLGNIGSALAQRLHHLGAQVIGVRKHPERKVHGVERIVTLQQLDEVLPCADTVILCLPANDETKGCFQHRLFTLMKESAVFVNVGRGSLVSLNDIQSALDAHCIGGAILDVTEIEPLPKEHPLWDYDNVLITPHVAGTFANADSFSQFEEIVLNNLKRYHEGKPLLNERRH